VFGDPSNFSGNPQQVVTLASVGDVRAAVVAHGAVTYIATILLLAVAMLAPAKLAGYVPRALP
jgi:hypothetical protein